MIPSSFLADDLRRDLTSRDYEAAIKSAAELVSRFPRVGLCVFGSSSPPRSDLDMVAVVPDDWPVETVQALWREISSFVVSSSERRYLFKQKIRICPSSIWRRIPYVYWSIKPDSYKLVGGGPAPLPEMPGTAEFSYVSLLDKLFYDVQDLIGLRLSSEISLRSLLSRFYKIDEFSFPLAASIYGEARYAALCETVAARRYLFSGAEAPDEKERAELVSLLEELLGGLKRVLLDVCEDFIPRVIEIRADGAFNPRAVERARFFMPILFKYHRAAYARLSDEDFLLKRRLALQDLPFPFAVRTGPYAELLRAQMRTAFEAEHALVRFGVPSFSMHVAGFWHTADRSLYSRDLRIYWAKRLAGPFRALFAKQ